MQHTGQGARGDEAKARGEGQRARELREPVAWPGDLVRLRDRAWRVTRTHRDDDVAALALCGVEPDNRHDARTVLAPFEQIVPIACPARPHGVTLGRWLRGLVALGLHDGAYALPRSAALARVALFPYQLAPTLAVLNGQASRLLVADEVGLGKTIQAAILLRELTDRDLVRRALIIVPAGLREQWQGELATRVDIHAEVGDAAWAMRVGQTLPPDTNPWQLPAVCLVSHDYIKQPEVLNAVAACSWDLVIIDEAHTLTPPTWRAEAAQRLGRTARWLLLLTATPHRGDEAAFRALCNTGRLGHDDVVVMFRRRREDVGLLRARTTRVLRIRPSTAEVRLHAELTRYATRIWAEPSVSAGARLVTSVLTKRALSCAFSLARSLERRRALLDRAPSLETEQLSLPLDVGTEPSRPEDDVSDEVLMAPGLSDRRLEQRWLGTLGTLAMRAQETERKRAALVRLVRRTDEPLVVFTEYRDTLAMLVQAVRRVASVAVLHGAQDAGERRDALACFDDGRARVLVATDAACEGLNLHARCRFVVVYELPWNPNRLEQRIGRVDRLGQAKRVHVIELVLAGSREDTVLTRLCARLSRIGAALDPFGEPAADSATRTDRPAKIGPDSAMHALEAAMVVGNHGALGDPRHTLEPRATQGDPAQVVRTGDGQTRLTPPDEQAHFLSRLDLEVQSREACAELRRLRRLRALWGGKIPRIREISSVVGQMQRRAPWIAVLDARRRMKHRQGGSALPAAWMPGTTLVLLFITELRDSSGRAVISIPTILAGACSALQGVTGERKVMDASARRRGPQRGSRAGVARPYLPPMVGRVRRTRRARQFIDQLVASPHWRERVAAATDAALAAARDADERLLARLRERERRAHGERERLARLHAPDLFGRSPTHLSQPRRATTDTRTFAPPEPRYITRVSLQLALLIADG
ncbi:MAG: hypothetical protein GEV06_04585 [Luteitalea sp.]|nr:hypothetical protein [Luteitalea sp.]